MPKKAVFGIALVTLACGILMPEVLSGDFKGAWAQLAPNLFAEGLGLLGALLVAEVLIRQYRPSKGVKAVGPLFLQAASPLVSCEVAILRGMDYTPNEFKAIMKGGDCRSTSRPISKKG
ncbi:MAG: hypothetical protein RhofKO_32820 [Rhodothermales bacterium]